MKKLLTLLLSAGIFSSSFAQKGHDYDNRRMDHKAVWYKMKHDHDGRDKHDNNWRNNSYAYQRKIQIDRINREYSYKVMSIEHNRFMNRRQKKFAIRDAMKERNYRLQMLNRRMNSYADNRYTKHFDGDRR